MYVVKSLLYIVTSYPVLIYLYTLHHCIIAHKHPYGICLAIVCVMLLFLVLSVFYSVKNIESKEKNDPVSLNVSTYFVKKKLILMDQLFEIVVQYRCSLLT